MNKKSDINIRFLEDSLLINNEILVFSDVHIGFEEHIIESGALPDMQITEILERIERIFTNLEKNKIKIKEIVIVGDLKHEFGGISDKEWRETTRFLDYLEKKIQKKGKIILVRGNHDNILGPIAKKKDVKLVDFYNKSGICFIHGNKLYKNCFENSKTIILGHLHPSITLSDEYKREKFKCFLLGKWKNKQVIVLPSFSPISFGYDLNNFSYVDEKNKGFFIINEKKLKDFEVIIYNNHENLEYNFGKLKKLI